MKIEHLSDEQIERFRDRRLSGTELLDVDDHLADCRDCRERAWSRLDASGSLSHLRGDIRESVSPHLEYSDVIRLASGAFTPGTDSAANHAEECSICRQEVADLRRFQGTLEAIPRPSESEPGLETEEKRPADVPRHRFWQAAPVWGAIAATIILAVVLSTAVRSPMQPQSQGPTAAPAVQSAEAQLPVEYRQLIERTLAPDAPSIPAVLEPLTRSRGTLRSAGPAAKSYNVEMPAGVITASARPQFRWQAVPGAKSYTISVYDGSYRKVVESPALSTTEWTPSTPLPREVMLSWQVNANVKGEVLRFPAPPDPEAVFQVLNAVKAAELDSVSSRFPKAHLLLGVMSFNDGALDDAAAALAQVPSGSPDAPSATRLLNRIHAIEHPRK